MNVVKLQRFSTHDGPGVRTVVFLKGCPLRCVWCHNPETQLAARQLSFHPMSCIGCGECARVCPNNAHTSDDTGAHIILRENCAACMACAEGCPSGALEAIGKEMSIPEVINAVKRDAPFYGKDGGITLSGGEPMFQPEACLELLSAAKAQNITTAVETCGFFPEKYARTLGELTDTLLWDFKDGVSDRHKHYTGAPNEPILKNLALADETCQHIILRCIMVNGVNMDDENLTAIARTYHNLRHCDGVELIPYHAYGSSKSTQLGGDDVGNIRWIPTNEQFTRATNYLMAQKCVVIQN